MERVFIGIGSNIGDSVANCLTSITKISEDRRAKLISRSSLYVTSPVSAIEQDDFINCAICITWDDSPVRLLKLLNSIEESMGRKRGIKDGPRTIDLDILLFGDLILETPSLTIPHPGLHKRRFAIVPCIDIEPALVHPLQRKQLYTFLSDLGDDQKIDILLEAGDRTFVPLGNYSTSEYNRYRKE